MDLPSPDHVDFHKSFYTALIAACAVDLKMTISTFKVHVCTSNGRVQIVSYFNTQ